MPKFSEKKIQIIDKEIRAWLVRLPESKQTTRNLAELTGYDKNFIATRLQKIKRARVHKFHHYTVKKYLAKYQEEIQMLNEELLSIINNNLAKPAERATAVRAYAQNSKELFDKMFEAGIFEKKLGEVDVKHKTLGAESVNAFLGEYKTIDGEVVEEKEPKELPAKDEPKDK